MNAIGTSVTRDVRKLAVSTRSRLISVFEFLALALAGLTITACGSGGDTAVRSDQPASRSTVTATASVAGSSTGAAGAPAASTASVDKTVYVGGTKIDVQSVSIDAGSMVVKARVTNQNHADGAALRQIEATPVSFQSSSGQTIELRLGQSGPVPVGGNSPFTWEGRVRETAVRLDGGRLVFGSTDSNQSSVTIGTGAVSTFVPKVGFGVGATSESRSVRYEILESSLRASHRSGDRGRFVIQLKFKVTGKIRDFMYTVDGGLFKVATPSGNRAAGARDYSDLYALSAGLDKDVTEQGWIAFLVEEVSGTFRVATYVDPQSGPEEVTEISFTIP